MNDPEAEDAQTIYPRTRSPEPPDCDHGAGRCDCGDDGSAALNPSVAVRIRSTPTGAEVLVLGSRWRVAS